MQMSKRKKQKLSKYNEVISTLSPLFKKNPGCDSECYKTFKSFKVPTVTSRKDETKKLTRSNFSSTSEYLSKQNILPALRIFCVSKIKK